MALRDLRSLAYDDDELYDKSRGMPDGWEPPEYPPGCCFSLPKADLMRMGGDGGRPGQTMRFSAMCEVTSVHDAIDDSRRGHVVGGIGDRNVFVRRQRGWINREAVGTSSEGRREAG